MSILKTAAERAYSLFKTAGANNFSIGFKYDTDPNDPKLVIPCVKDSSGRDVTHLIEPTDIINAYNAGGGKRVKRVSYGNKQPLRMWIE